MTDTPNWEYDDIAKMIDHALLTPSMTREDLEAGIRLAKLFNVASVCILPYYVGRCAELLADSSVLPSTVIGFPHGGQATAVKAFEARTAIEDGCQELDMVVNISAVLSDEWEQVTADIRAVIEPAHAADRQVKVIFENCYLRQSHKIRLCEICNGLGADWIKTSTGFGSSGATIDDLRLMLEHARGAVQVKAAGGIRDLETVLKARELGVTRVGASKTADILNECRRRLNLEPYEVSSCGPTGY